MEKEERYGRAVELVENMKDDERLRFYSWLSRRMGWHYAPKAALKIDRLKLYVKVMNGIIGADIRQRSRQRNVVMGRYIVIHRLLAEGASTVWVGKMFGVTHCTSIHARGVVEDWLLMPRVYMDEVAIYRKFNQIIDKEYGQTD